MLCAVLATAVWLGACGGKSAKDDPILQEAAKIHEEAHEIQEGIEPTVAQFDSLKTLLTNKKTTLADSLAAQADEAVASLDKIKADLESWEENLVVVPGMEHDHEHEGHNHEGHDHKHDHKPAPDVTPEQMLDIQKEIKKNIEAIKTELDATMAKVKGLLQ